MQPLQISDLTLFRHFITHLSGLDQAESSGARNDFFQKWDPMSQLLQDIASQILDHQQKQESIQAQEARYYIRSNWRRLELMVYQPWIPYFLTGIEAYERAMERDLLPTLWDKSLGEMNGFELRTLALAILEVHARRSSL